MTFDVIHKPHRCFNVCMNTVVAVLLGQLAIFIAHCRRKVDLIYSLIAHDRRYNIVESFNVSIGFVFILCRVRRGHRIKIKNIYRAFGIKLAYIIDKLFIVLFKYRRIRPADLIYSEFDVAFTE